MRFTIIKRLQEPDSMNWLAVLVGLEAYFLMMSIELGWGLEIGLGLYAELVIVIGFVAVLHAGKFLVGLLVGLVLVKVPLRLPFYYIGSLTGIMLFYPKAFSYNNINYAGAFALTGFKALFASAAGLFLYLILFRRLSTIVNRALLVLSFFTLVVYAYFLADMNGLTASTAKLPFQEATIEEPLQYTTADPLLPAPHDPGPYAVTTLTYGSGEDLRRKAYGFAVDAVTSSVDASGFIKKWNSFRAWYWGFDLASLPVNGRVWLPAGEGPFPVVLIVHGNHTMEEFSDNGYAYLGELLASKGFLTVSVDENFANYSVWSGIPTDDYALRAWMLLQHLQAIDELSSKSDSLLRGKADMTNIALIGHSRGGQAAVLAAAYDSFYEAAGKQAHLAGVHYPINAVVAIAPTDKRLENRYLNLQDVNYLLLQGGFDSDVSTFDGDRQYNRVQFSRSANDYRFKASIYIGEANHGQFNTSWGKHDLTLPTKLLMNTREIMSGQAQRTVAQAYIAAFLEAALHNNRSYLPMLKDWRWARQWLPAATYLARFEDSRMIKLADFEEDAELETASYRRVTLKGVGLKTWEEAVKQNRLSGSTLNKAVKLEWEEGQGSYRIGLPRSSLQRLTNNSSFVFSLAHAAAEPLEEPLKFSLRLTSANGQTVQLPMNNFQLVHPVIQTRFLNAGWLEPYVRGGKLRTSSEPILQDYFIPFSRFIAENPHLNVRQLIEIAIVFDQSDHGMIWLDDLRLNP